MKTFNESEFREKCKQATKVAHAGSGLFFEIYQSRLSAAIESIIFGLPKEYQQQAADIARSDYEYIPSNEIVIDRSNGECCHGIDPDCCPLGCGDID